MTTGDTPAGHDPGLGQLGTALRRALAGYRRQLDDDLVAAGFPDRRFPEGRVLVMCGGPEEITISEIGRRLDITRQGASKIVAGLRERGYVAVTPSPADGREKLVTLTPRAAEMLAVRVRSGQRLEARVREEIGPGGMDQLLRALDLIAAGDDDPPGGRPAMRRLRWRDAEDEL